MLLGLSNNTPFGLYVVMSDKNNLSEFEDNSFDLITTCFGLDVRMNIEDLVFIIIFVSFSVANRLHVAKTIVYE